MCPNCGKIFKVRDDQKEITCIGCKSKLKIVISEKGPEVVNQLSC